LRDEFGFKVVLHHASDAWKVAGELAKARAPCSVIVVDAPGGKIEAMDMSLATGAVLEQAGVPCAFHTDDPVTDSRLFLRTAALAVRAGMSRDKALEALTLAGAKMLELDGRIGSLGPGKDADLILLSGDPLALRTKVLQTWVEGRKVFDGVLGSNQQGRQRYQLVTESIREADAVANRLGATINRKGLVELPPGLDGPDFVKGLVDGGVRIDSWTQEKQSLEDTYLELTGVRKA
jgi:hypothetical protein